MAFVVDFAVLTEPVHFMVTFFTVVEAFPFGAGLFPLELGAEVFPLSLNRLVTTAGGSWDEARISVVRFVVTFRSIGSPLKDRLV